MKFSIPVFANFVWAGLLLESRLIAIPVILAGLIIEYFFVRRLTGFEVKRSIIADLTMNAASLLLGLILIPLAGLVWEFSAGVLLYDWNNQIGSFHPVNLGATFILAVLINAAIENFILRRIFKLEKAKAGFRWLCLANTFSVGIALASLWFFPIRNS
ncbi:MAG: hypothetical protein M3384_14365 [Acidobacteriota bacterium]|nr:hypothetical protein [Acidobacteriota bacterium]